MNLCQLTKTITVLGQFVSGFRVHVATGQGMELPFRHKCQDWAFSNLINNPARLSVEAQPKPKSNLTFSAQT